MWDRRAQAWALTDCRPDPRQLREPLFHSAPGATQGGVVVADRRYLRVGKVGDPEPEVGRHGRLLDEVAERIVARQRFYEEGLALASDLFDVPVHWLHLSFQVRAELVPGHLEQKESQQRP